MARTCALLALICPVAKVTPLNFLRDSAAALGFGFELLPPRETVTVEGARLKIPCRPMKTNKGVANVTWTKDGKPINEASSYVLQDGSLLISKVSKVDVSSQYRCVLEMGTRKVVSPPLNLVLAAAGAWQMRPKKAKGREGSPVRLTCHMPSLPTAQLFWYKGSEPLSIETNSRYYQPSPGVLQITNITQEDSGIYKCKGVNPLIKNDFMSPGVQLVVEGHHHHAPNGDAEGEEEGRGGEVAELAPLPRSKPTLLATPSKVEVQVGHRTVLECITDDVSNPKLLWSRIDGREIRRSGVRTEGQGSLAFQAVKEYDAGVYNCSVVSPLLKSPVTQMFELSVLKPPRVNITIIPQGGQVPNGESIVRINCSASGFPRPEISWYKDGKAVPLSGRHIFDTLEMDRNFTLEQLAIREILLWQRNFRLSQDLGVFQCIAKNRAGVASEGVLLTVKLSPNMPGVAQNVTVLDKTSKSILVTWSPPTPVVLNKYHSDVGYVIHYLEIAGSDQEKQVVTNNTSFRISELRPYTLYSIYVRTFTIELDQIHPLFGEPTPSLLVQTQPDVPTKLPDVRLTALSPTVLRVQWELLTQEQARGPVTHQMVEWRRNGASDNSFVEVSPEDNVYDIKDLHPNKWYDARVLARTPAGYPDAQLMTWEKVKMLKKGNSDKRPTLHLSVNSDNPTQILVEWELAKDLRAQVFSYSVSYNNSHGSESHRNLQASASSIILDDLEVGTCYSVCVVPMYKRGRETDKTSVTQTICTLTPSPPHIPPTDNNAKIGVKKVKVKTLSTTSIQVTWRPKGRRVTPEFFTVKVVHLGKQKVCKDKDLDSPKDVDGDQSQSEPLRGNPPQPLKESQTVVPDPEDSGEEGEGEEPEVRYWRVTGRKVILNDLKPLNQYEISVSASTLAVSSALSEPVVVTTTEGVPTAPLNVSWKAATPKDVDLVWSRPEHINGHLLYYLVTYSHDLLEWKNHTVDSHFTSTQIRDLVSNTNYTVQISGVTRGGRGTLTTVFVYINATLVGEPHISTELVVIIVVTLLAAITFTVVVILCLRVIRLRQSAATSAFQGNGTCRMIYANGLKPASRDCTELNDYKPMLTSLPPAIHNHHLDTKGGPGAHGDGVVVNCLLEVNASSMNQGDVPNENHVPPRDGIGSSNLEDSLDDIDDDDDASSKLLQTISDGCSPLTTDLDSRCTGESTQVEPGCSSSDSGAGAVEVTASS
ncbi:LOW QUALITY PROTEIN: protogenin B-like [Macrobrachium rosenbergii]|uniref:LOW QUALITY PROTEIN: protogenin B-like n=1 Tax=Macrobrachium rosenbergii TaxID=79674 RepID=UPI0034D5FD61